MDKCVRCLEKDTKYLEIVRKDLHIKNVIIIILVILYFVTNMYLLYIFTNFNVCNINTTNINNQDGIANYNDDGQIALTKKEIE